MLISPPANLGKKKKPQLSELTAWSLDWIELMNDRETGL